MTRQKYYKIKPSLHFFLEKDLHWATLSHLVGIVSLRPPHAKSSEGRGERYVPNVARGLPAIANHRGLALCPAIATLLSRRAPLPSAAPARLDTRP